MLCNLCTPFSAVRSRSLLSVENPQNFQKAACDLLSHIFLGDKDPHLTNDDPPPMEVSSFMEVTSQQREGGVGREGVWEQVGKWRGGTQGGSQGPELCTDLQQGNDTCMSIDS